MRMKKYARFMQTYLLFVLYFIVIANPNQQKILWYIFDWALCAQKLLVAYIQISHVLFMQISHALQDDCQQKLNARDHHYWMGILMMLMSEQTIRII